MALTDIVGDGNEVMPFARGDVGTLVDIVDAYFYAPARMTASMWVGTLEVIPPAGNTYSRSRVVNT